MIICVMSEGSKEDKLRHIFRIFDKDGSGSISNEELVGIVTHLYHLIPIKEKREAGTPGQLAQRIMTEADRNKVIQTSSELLSQP